MKLVVNSTYENLVPPLTDTEYDSLKKSIETSGLWIPILTNRDGIILDGHNRFKICQDLGITPRFAIREFENELFEKKFVIECNLKRRHLNDFQKSELGIPLLKINQELAKQNQGKRTDLTSSSNEEKVEPYHAGKQTANEIGVSKATFERAKKVIETAPEEVKQKLREGNPHTSISKEYQKLKKNEKREIRQNEIKSLQVKLPSAVTLYNQEFQTAPVAPNSVSLIITDPPYHEKYLHLYDDLGEHAAKVLRDGGSLITYAGHYAIGTIINKMEKHGLKFHWPIAVIHSGPSASVFGRKILVGYKPMLWFVKGKYEGEFVRDVIQSEFEGKELHDWAQSTKESDYYVKYLTIENEIVYDPFMGQGTFGISAVRQNRQFIGCEVDPDHFANAERMISNGN